MDTLGSMIKSLRKKSGKSQMDLSLAAGWENPSTLSRIESDDVKPSRETIIKIAEGLRLSKDETYILLRLCNYQEYKADITKDYIEGLYNNVMEEWNNLLHPIVLVSQTSKVICLNKAANILFFDGSAQSVLTDNNFTHIDLLFDEKLKITKNIVNIDEFANIVIQNIMTNVHQAVSADLNQEEIFNNWMQLPLFAKYFNNFKISHNPEYKSHNIPFIYRLKNTNISFSLSTYSLFSDSRFVVEEFIPASIDDTKIISEYLSRKS